MSSNSTQTETKENFELSLSASGGGDLGPTLAKTAITRELAEEILEIAHFVRQKEAYKMEIFYSSVTWFTGDELDDEDEDDTTPPEECRTECDSLNIGREEFWFTCYPKHIEDKATSSKTSLADLAAHFGLSLPAVSETTS